LIEDSMPLADKPRRWRPKQHRPTSNEITYWLRSGENRRLNERARDDFNERCVDALEQLPVTIVSEIPPVGFWNRMSVTKNCVYYRPNALKPVVNNVYCASDLAPRVPYLQFCFDVVRANQYANTLTEKKRTLDHLIEESKKLSKKERNPYIIIP
jgi:hypothetical protein